MAQVGVQKAMRMIGNPEGYSKEVLADTLAVAIDEIVVLRYELSKETEEETEATPSHVKQNQAVFPALDGMYSALIAFNAGYIAGIRSTIADADWEECRNEGVYPERNELRDYAREYAKYHEDLINASYGLVERRIEETVQHIDNTNHGRHKA